MKRLLLILVLAVGVLLPTTAVWAFTYQTLITVTENATVSYTQLPVTISSNTTYLVSNNFITATGLDTLVTESGGAIPHMLADDRLLFTVDLPATGSKLLQYEWGNTPISAFYIITGYNGYITVPDDANLELGDDFEIKVKGYINTDDGSNKNIVFKDNAFRIYVSSTTSGNVTASITSGANVTASSVLSGEHTIEVSANVTHLRIYVDTVLMDSQPIISAVPGTADNWTLLQNNVMPYVEYVEFWVR